MALVIIIPTRAGSLEGDRVRGRPNAVSKITSVPGSFAVAGSPNYVVPVGTGALIIISDTAIDFVVVRSGGSPTSEAAWPIPVATGGLSQFIMLLEDGDDDVFIRALA